MIPQLNWHHTMQIYWNCYYFEQLSVMVIKSKNTFFYVRCNKVGILLIYLKLLIYHKAECNLTFTIF